MPQFPHLANGEATSIYLLGLQGGENGTRTARLEQRLK